MERKAPENRGYGSLFKHELNAVYDVETLESLECGLVGGVGHEQP